MRKEEAITYFKRVILDELYKIPYITLFKKTDPIFIAGGAIRDYYMHGKVTNDIDLYFQDAHTMSEVKKYLLENGGIVTFETKNAIKIKYKELELDLIQRYFNSPSECIENFDFTVCSCACDTKNIYAHEFFLNDLAARKLKFNNIVAPSSTMLRIIKYIKKGFDISYQDLLIIINAIKGEDDLNETLSIIESLKNDRKEASERSFPSF